MRLFYIKSNDCMDTGARTIHRAITETLKKHSSNCFSNAAIDNNKPLENHSSDFSKYIQTVFLALWIDPQKNFAL